MPVNPSGGIKFHFDKIKHGLTKHNHKDRGFLMPVIMIPMSSTDNQEAPRGILPALRYARHVHSKWESKYFLFPNTCLQSENQNDPFINLQDNADEKTAQSEMRPFWARKVCV